MTVTVLATRIGPTVFFIPCSPYLDQLILIMKVLISSNYDTPNNYNMIVDKLYMYHYACVHSVQKYMLLLSHNYIFQYLTGIQHVQSPCPVAEWLERWAVSHIYAPVKRVRNLVAV